MNCPQLRKLIENIFFKKAKGQYSVKIKYDHRKFVSLF